MAAAEHAEPFHTASTNRRSYGAHNSEAGTAIAAACERSERPVAIVEFVSCSAAVALLYGYYITKVLSQRLYCYCLQAVDTYCWLLSAAVLQYCAQSLQCCNSCFVRANILTAAAHAKTRTAAHSISHTCTSQYMQIEVYSIIQYTVNT
eukprot:13940-Heterococcus_DN1.PRE.3